MKTNSQNLINNNKTIQSLKQPYHNLSTNLFKQSQNLQILFSKFQQDKNNLEKPSNLRLFVRQLYSINENYFTIIPLLFLTYFKKELLINKKSIIEIDRFLNKKIQSFGDRFIRKQIQQIKDQQNIKFDISQLKQKFKKNYNLFSQNSQFDNFQMLVLQITKVSDKAKQNFQQFIQFTHQICINNGALQYKANTKLPFGNSQTKQFRNYMRITQKMFEKQFSQRQKQQFLLQLQKRIKLNQIQKLSEIGRQIFNLWIQLIQKVLKQKKQKNEKIACFISDFIRGCCYFKTKKDIINTAEQIIKQCKIKNYQIIDISQRILRGTHQIIFKIHLNNTIAEFQLIRVRQNIQFDQQNRQYIHQLYQIRRSVMGGIFGSFLLLSKVNQILIYELNKQEIMKKLDNSLLDK